MTEIPEHLLKRSRERRAAMGRGGDAPEGAPGESGADAPSDAPVPAAATPAPAPTAAVEEAKPEPPAPEPAYIQAAKKRKRMPYWAASVLAALPLWGYMYVRTLEPPPAGEDDPLTLGGEVYAANCASLPRRQRRRRRRRPAVRRHGRRQLARLARPGRLGPHRLRELPELRPTAPRPSPPAASA